MKATIEKIEVTAIVLIMALTGIAGTAWILREMHSSLFACAAATPFIPVI